MLPKTLNLNDPAAVNRFIGGRRRVNAQRHYDAIERRYRLMFLWLDNIYLNQSDLARKLGVARSTVSKDIKALKKEAADFGRCPVCDAPYYPQDRRPQIEQIRAVSHAGRYLRRIGAM